MLGNALVPLVARLAFARLLSGYKIRSISDMSIDIRMTANPEGKLVKGKGKVKHGSYSNGVIMRHDAHETNMGAVVTVILDPKFYNTKREYTENPSRSPLPALKGKQRLTRFPTPRKMSPTHSYSLNERTIRDLPTVAMFASYINGIKQKKTDDTKGINPEFVEWLMGFPEGYTEY